MFLPEWWQQGFASESLAAVPKHTFTDLQLPFVVAETQTKSTRSVRLLEKLGFHFVEQVERFNASQPIYSIKKDDMI